MKKYLFLSFIIICFFSKVNCNSEPFNLTDNCKVVFQRLVEKPEYNHPNIKFFDNKMGIAFFSYRKTITGPNKTVFYNEIYKTEDSGTNWSLILVDSLYPPFIGQRIRLTDRADDTTAFAYSGAVHESFFNIATNPSNVLKINLKNNSFERYLLPDFDIPVNIVCYDADTLFCLSEHRLSKSTNRGVKWEILDLDEPVEYLKYFKLEKTNNNELYLWVKSGYDSSDVLKISKDCGKSWDIIKLPGWLTYAHQILNSKEVLIGCDTIPSSPYKLYPKYLVKYNIESKQRDTVYTYKGYFDIEKEIFVSAKNNPNIIIMTISTNRLHVSNDGGKSFKLDSMVYDGKVIKDWIENDFCSDTMFFWKCYEGTLFKQTKPYTDVTDEIPQFKTKLFPNPAVNEKPVFLSLENDKIRAVKLSIYNSAGELVDCSQLLNIPIGYHTIDYTPRGFIPGVYFMVIESGNEILLREKFVVE